MKTLGSIIGWIVELAIPVGLLWQGIKLYNLGWTHFDLYGVLNIILLILLIMFAHWLRLNKKQYPKRIYRKLLLRTGPSIILSFFLIIILAIEMINSYGLTYHFDIALDKIEKHSSLPKGKITFESRLLSTRIPQRDVIHYLRFERLKSELLIYVMLLVTLCILYKTRTSSSRIPAMETTNAEQGKDDTS
jgi:hypothetical protein